MIIDLETKKAAQKPTNESYQKVIKAKDEIIEGLQNIKIKLLEINNIDIA